MRNCNRYTTSASDLRRPMTDTSSAITKRRTRNGDQNMTTTSDIKNSSSRTLSTTSKRESKSCHIIFGVVIIVLLFLAFYLIFI